MPDSTIAHRRRAALVVACLAFAWPGWAEQVVPPFQEVPLDADPRALAPFVGEWYTSVALGPDIAVRAGKKPTLGVRLVWGLEARRARLDGERILLSVRFPDEREQLFALALAGERWLTLRPTGGGELRWCTARGYRRLTASQVFVERAMLAARDVAEDAVDWLASRL